MLWTLLILICFFSAIRAAHGAATELPAGFGGHVLAIIVGAPSGRCSEPDAPQLDQFVNGKWVLRIDRAILAERLGHRPRTEEVDESEYRPISEGSTYPILVSDHGARVDIDGEKRTAVHPPMKGARSSPTEPVVYKLDVGTFAGGRFVVWSGKNGLQGELTIYGSGVPIISSERGTISRQR